MQEPFILIIIRLFRFDQQLHEERIKNVILISNNVRIEMC
jgi:hypothetical protein